MRLTFDAEKVRQLREHAAKAKTYRPCYAHRDKEPGLWLVGDQGVYLMSNGSPGLLRGDGPDHVVAYAKECNPETMPFDEWWDAKRASFGGDDGVEFIPLASVPKSGNIAIDVGPNKLSVYETEVE